MSCRNSTCANAFVARKKRGVQGIRWVVECAPRCTCPPLSEAEKRTRNVKTALLSAKVMDAIKNTVASNKHTSKVRQVADNVQALTGERIKTAQCRCALRRPFLALAWSLNNYHLPASRNIMIAANGSGSFISSFVKQVEDGMGGSVVVVCAGIYLAPE